MRSLAQLAARWRPEKPATRTCGPIGIDLARDKMHLLQFTRDADSGVLVRACMSVAYPATRDDVLTRSNALYPLLRSALRHCSFSGRHAVVALPGGAFRTMSVVYQVSPGQSEAKVLAGLMRERLEGDLTDYVIDYIPIRTRNRDSERLALVATSRRDDVVRFLEEFRRAGLEVDALEIGPLAVRRLINALPGVATDDNVIVVNTGRIATYVTILAGRRLLSDQEFRFGEDALLGQLSRSLDMSAEAARELVMRTGLAPLRQQDQFSMALNETGIFNTLLEIVKPELMRLVTEIERAVLFTASETHGGKVKCIYLVGALSRWRGIARALNHIVGLGVHNLSAPLESFVATDDPVASTPDMIIAGGLALKGLTDNG